MPPAKDEECGFNYLTQSQLRSAAACRFYGAGYRGCGRTRRRNFNRMPRPVSKQQCDLLGRQSDLNVWQRAHNSVVCHNRFTFHSVTSHFMKKTNDRHTLCKSRLQRPFPRTRPRVLQFKPGVCCAGVISKRSAKNH